MSARRKIALGLAAAALTGGMATVTGPAAATPATGQSAAAECGVRADGKLWCGNRVGAKGYEHRRYNSAVRGPLNTSPSWFQCWGRGDQHAAWATTSGTGPSWTTASGATSRPWTSTRRSTPRRACASADVLKAATSPPGGGGLRHVSTRAEPSRPTGGNGAAAGLGGLPVRVVRTGCGDQEDRSAPAHTAGLRSAQGAAFASCAASRNSTSSRP